MFRTLSIAGALGASIFAAAPALAQKTLRVVPLLEVRLLDPYQNTNYGTRNHGHMIYEQLFALDSKLQPQPMMVGEHRVSDDKLNHTFKLRAGLEISRWRAGDERRCHRFAGEMVQKGRVRRTARGGHAGARRG